MRQDNIELPRPPGGDRPGDAWMDGLAVDQASENHRVRTWTGRRRRWTLSFMIVVLLGATVIFAVVPSADLFSPGALSTPHAQILSGAVTSERCGACHSEATLSPLSWFQGGGGGHADVNQNDLCLDCHHRTIPENLAYSAHNLPLSVRDQLTGAVRLASSKVDDDAGFSMHRLIPKASVDQNDVACGTCHKEHHGTDGDLLAISDAQCQTCHNARFGSFAESHPSWNRWPYGRGGEISFNHASHQQKHFPGSRAGKKKFDCAVCHPDAAATSRDPAVRTGEVVRVASYERSCQACHDESMNLQAARGVDFIALPSLPENVATEVGNWPDRATGFTDGVISPLTELLLRADLAVSGVLRRIPDGDLSLLPIGDDATDERLVLLAMELRKLMNEFGSRGQTVIQHRLSQIGISSQPFQPILRSLPPQLIESANQKWFQQQITTHATMRPLAAAGENLLGESLLLGGEDSGDLLGGDLLSDAGTDDPLTKTMDVSEPVTSAIAASHLVPGGGWYRDDKRVAVGYRGHGHADPVLVGLIETFGQLSDGDPLKRRFFADSAVAACVACHASATSVPARWQAAPNVGRRTDFTKFSHRPHLNDSALGSCVHCHQVGQLGATHETTTDFLRLDRQACAVCHNAKAAGDNCTKCHRYHIGR